ncbi:MAG: hypothetical protein ACOCU8_01485 [Patescibacteria group bacterium]
MKINTENSFLYNQEDEDQEEINHGYDPNKAGEVIKEMAPENFPSESLDEIKGKINNLRQELQDWESGKHNPPYKLMGETGSSLQEQNVLRLEEEIREWERKKDLLEGKGISYFKSKEEEFKPAEPKTTEDLEKENQIEVENAEKINQTKSFEELYDVLREIGKIKGTTGVYSATNLITLIENVRSAEKIRDGLFQNNTITRTYGIRNKVWELFVAEKEIVADTEEEMADKKESSESAEDNEVMEKSVFADLVKKTKEKMENLQPKALKRRFNQIKSYFSLNKINIRQAERFRQVTNEADKLIKERVSLFIDEQREITDDEVDAKLNEMIKELFSEEKPEEEKEKIYDEDKGVEREKTPDDLTEEEIDSFKENIKTEIFKEREKQNSEIEDQITEAVIGKLKARLTREYKDLSAKNYQGENILAEGKLDQLRQDIKIYLRVMRATKMDISLLKFNSLIRKNLDPQWYKRYVAGGIGDSLASVTAKITGRDSGVNSWWSK